MNENNASAFFAGVYGKLQWSCQQLSSVDVNFMGWAILIKNIHSGNKN